MNVAQLLAIQGNRLDLCLHFRRQLRLNPPGQRGFEGFGVQRSKHVVQRSDGRSTVSAKAHGLNDLRRLQPAPLPDGVLAPSAT